MIPIAVASGSIVDNAPVIWATASHGVLVNGSTVYTAW